MLPHLKLDMINTAQNAADLLHDIARNRQSGTQQRKQHEELEPVNDSFNLKLQQTEQVGLALWNS